MSLQPPHPHLESGYYSSQLWDLVPLPQTEMLMDAAGRYAARPRYHGPWGLIAVLTPFCPAVLPPEQLCVPPVSTHQLSQGVQWWSTLPTALRFTCYSPGCLESLGPPLHVFLPSLSPYAIPFPSLPNQSVIAGDRTAHPGHSLARWCKASGIHRRWESSPSQGEQERGKVSIRAVDADPLLPAPRTLGQNASLQCGHQPSQLEECLRSPLLQFRSACS